jgi:hypothetical protein
MDAIALTGIIAGVTGLVVAILTHVRHSECCKGLVEFDTREINEINERNEREQATVLSNPPTPIPTRSTAV